MTLGIRKKENGKFSMAKVRFRFLSFISSVGVCACVCSCTCTHMGMYEEMERHKERKLWIEKLVGTMEMVIIFLFLQDIDQNQKYI